MPALACLVTGMVTVKTMDKLSRVLEGLTDREQALFRQFIMEEDISTDDEFWAVFAAIATLRATLIDAPERLESQFEAMRNDLAYHQRQNLNAQQQLEEYRGEIANLLAVLASQERQMQQVLEAGQGAIAVLEQAQKQLDAQAERWQVVIKTTVQIAQRVRGGVPGWLVPYPAWQRVLFYMAFGYFLTFSSLVAYHLVLRITF